MLKKPRHQSPGIIVFTHNEALRGLPRTSNAVKEFLLREASDKNWIFGIHVQGDCSYLSEWPIEGWESFFMWSDWEVNPFSSIPVDKRCNFTCINFMQDVDEAIVHSKKPFDLCIVTRPAAIKRFDETLGLLAEIYKKRPSTKTVLIAPDPRESSRNFGFRQKKEEAAILFSKIQNYFSSEALRNISFISSSTEFFGQFPVSQQLIISLLAMSKTSLLYSHSEGVPRCIIESLLVGTPVFVSRNLRSGLRDVLTSENSWSLTDDLEHDAQMICTTLDNESTLEFSSDVYRQKFCESKTVPKFKSYLSSLFVDGQVSDDESWRLDNLCNRLSCHGQKANLQYFNNDELFFRWLRQALESPSEIEDCIYGPYDYSDKSTGSFLKQFQRISGKVYAKCRRVV